MDVDKGNYPVYKTIDNSSRRPRHDQNDQNQCLTLSPLLTTIVPYMQTALVRMRRRVTRRLIWIQAV